MKRVQPTLMQPQHNTIMRRVSILVLLYSKEKDLNFKI
jgi:hypothetical protein